MKIILSCAITTNGFIAGDDDYTEWVSDEAYTDFRQIAQKAGVVIVGRRTYKMMRDYDELIENCFHVVLTHNKDLEFEDSQTLITTKHPHEVLKELENRGYKEVCIAGGGELNRSFMKEGLIDELYLDVEPKILGRGTALFAADEFEFDLELLETKQLTPQTTQLHYRVKR